MPRPKVLLISLAKQPFFDEMYVGLLRALRERSEVLEATNEVTANEYLRLPSTDLAAVFITDPSVIETRFASIASNIVQYAREGGTVIIGGHCSSFGRPKQFNKFFERQLSLPWRFGEYHRTTFSLNPSVAHDRFRKPNIPKSCSMKAVHIAGAPLESRVYVPTAASRIESNVFASELVTNHQESPVVFAEYGRGHMAWIGDVNTEDVSTILILEMCNL